jgi:hypothetical protein
MLSEDEEKISWLDAGVLAAVAAAAVAKAHSIDSRCMRPITGAKVAKFNDIDNGAKLTSIECANFTNRSSAVGECASALVPSEPVRA